MAGDGLRGQLPISVTPLSQDDRQGVSVSPGPIPSPGPHCRSEWSEMHGVSFPVFGDGTACWPTQRLPGTPIPGILVVILSGLLVSRSPCTTNGFPPFMVP